jgi:integrase
VIACELFDDGVDLRDIAAQLGHVSVAITDRYVNHANPKRRIAAIRARPRPDVQSTPRENQ